MANAAPELDNQAVADKLDEVAALLEVQGANRFRVEAYRSGARTVRGLSRSVAEIVDEEGLDGLEALPAIGETLARAIGTMIRVGSLPQLERLRGETDPEALFSTLPGIGPGLAERIHDELHIDSIEDLEAAAYDGRLAATPGFGAKRLEGIRAALSARLRRVRRSSARTSEAPSEPRVAEILDVDREYRDKARRGDLPTIAPRRMNPDEEAWLPILHTARGDRSYTALFSNTPLAHKLGRTDDWVVVYPENGASGRPFTVVTERRGALAGRRVVRGREEACRELYQTQGAA
ncbi:MAG: helix-hairpin-helix domain-containing protein [Trueperaceae bacterium]|nr:helix-hairpin-helix domain-containing protein [Trueperaceae bacterium]